MTDPISRSDAKAAIKARAKRYELTAPNSFEHGVYQGLKMALNEVCALANLPALDGDGKERREAVERPPMLRAEFHDGSGWSWYQRFIPRRDIGPWAMICEGNDPDILWHSRSSEFFRVDRDNSDPAAIRLYDLDLTSGDAAKTEE